ncbi:MAG TPA: hypothetical protein VFC57_03395 [Aeromicrobium sp.]|nr:hypothetical protein [Aeromicrobium sp.]
MAMSRSRLIAAEVVLVMGIVSVLLALGDDGVNSPDVTRDASSKAGSNSHSADSGTDSSGSTSDASGRSGSKKADRLTDGKASEVISQPESPAANGLPGLTRQKRAKNSSLISRPLPKTASSRGKIVDGLPVTIVPVAAGSTVQSSGVSSTATTLQVSIQATSTRSPGKVLAFYRAALSAHGFAESTVPSVGGSQAAGFAHNADNLIVTVTKSGTKGTAYSVFGTLHTGKSR